MPKLLIKILTAFITLSFGITAYFLWNWTFTTLPQVEVQENKLISQQITPIKITACQVLNIPESYNGKLVSIDATAFVAHDKVRLFPDETCNEIIDDFKLIIPVLELKNFSGTNNNLKNLLESSNITPAQEVDIRVIGIVKKYYGRRSDLQYLIIPNSIELISSMRKFEVKAAA